MKICMVRQFEQKFPSIKSLYENPFSRSADVVRLQIDEQSVIWTGCLKKWQQT
jgi:hypothetical protein